MKHGGESRRALSLETVLTETSTDIRMNGRGSGFIGAARGFARGTPVVAFISKVPKFFKSNKKTIHQIFKGVENPYKALRTDEKNYVH